MAFPFGSTFACRRNWTSAPTESWGHRRQNRLHSMHVVSNAKLVGDGDQKRVGLRDRLVFPKLFDQYIRLSRIGAAENRSCGPVNVADLVLDL